MVVATPVPEPNKINCLGIKKSKSEIFAFKSNSVFLATSVGLTGADATVAEDAAIEDNVSNPNLVKVAALLKLVPLKPEKVNVLDEVPKSHKSVPDD